MRGTCREAQIPIDQQQGLWHGRAAAGFAECGKEAESGAVPLSETAQTRTLKIPHAPHSLDSHTPHSQLLDSAAALRLWGFKALDVGASA